MAGSFTDFLELEILDHVFGAAAYTAPVTLYFSLSTTANTDAALGTEATGTNYARKDMTNNATNFPAAAGGAKSNGVAITFATAGSGGWGTVTHTAVHSAVTAGDYLAWADLDVSKTIDEGDTFEFAIGAFDVTLT